MAAKDIAVQRMRSGRVASPRKELDGRWSVNLYAADGACRRESFATRDLARQAFRDNERALG